MNNNSAATERESPDLETEVKQLLEVLKPRNFVYEYWHSGMGRFLNVLDIQKIENAIVSASIEALKNPQVSEVLNQISRPLSQWWEEVNETYKLGYDEDGGHHWEEKQKMIDGATATVREILDRIKNV